MARVPLPGQIRIVDDVPRAFARLFAELAPTQVALSGGETAHDCYAALRGEPIDWGRIDVFFGDDRVVAVTDPESNEGIARRILLDEAGPHAIHSLVGLGADAYDELLRSRPPLDLVHLGLGPDGHTASLFPGSPALAVEDRLVVETGDDLHPHPRLTFTFPGIARSRLAVVTVVGEEKRAAIDRIRGGADLPAARIEADAVLWLSDRAAMGDG